MLLERTIAQLDTGAMPDAEASHLAQLGYMQWMAGLPGHRGYRDAAQEALAMARPFAACSPAIAGFCALLQRSLDAPLTPLSLEMPPRKRRGGAGARRTGRMSL